MAAFVKALTLLANTKRDMCQLRSTTSLRFLVVLKLHRTNNKNNDSNNNSPSLPAEMARSVFSSVAVEEGGRGGRKKKKTETRMTASILNQDPNTRKVQKNAIY